MPLLSRERLLSLLAVVAVAGSCTGKAVSPPNPVADPGTGGTSTPPAGSGGAGGGSGGAAGSPAARLDAAAGPGGSGGSAGSGGGAGGRDGGGSTPADASRSADSGRAGDSGPATVPPTTPPAGPAGPWARGVRVGLVEGAQGVFVKIGDGATMVPAAMRNAPLVEGRPLFVRVHVTAEGGFTARRLRGVLSIEGGGAKVELEDAKMIGGSSNVEQLASTFNFLVPAESVKAGGSLIASIYEGGAAAGAEPTTPPRFPASGTADLAIKGGRLELHVVGVPAGMLTDTPERRKKLENDVYDLYPVQKVNLRIREPVTLDGAFSSSKGFAALRDARERDNAKPYEYYHLLVSASAGFAGVANRAGAGMNDGARRVAITIVRGNAIDGNTNTTAHEIGHNHGRPHAPGCGAAGPDADYPYTMPAGSMGVNGFSLTTATFKSKVMFRELMSYCRPRWISDYMWIKFEERLRIVNGFVTATPAMAQMMATRSLQGFAGPGEKPDWGIVAGALVDDVVPISAGRHAVLKLVDGREVRTPVAVNELSDHLTREFSVNLTGDDYSDADVLEAEVFVDGQRSLVPVSTMYRRR